MHQSLSQFFLKGEVVFCIVEQTNRISKWCVSIGWSANLQLDLAYLITLWCFIDTFLFRLAIFTMSKPTKVDIQKLISAVTFSSKLSLVIFNHQITFCLLSFKQSLANLSIISKYETNTCHWILVLSYALWLVELMTHLTCE